MNKIIKHIDFRENSIFIIFYDNQGQFQNIDESYLKMNCIVLDDVTDLFYDDWHKRGAV